MGIHQDLTYTAQISRADEKVRLAIVFQNIEELVQKLTGENYQLSDGKHWDNHKITFEYGHFDGSFRVSIHDMKIKFELGESIEWQKLYMKLAEYYLGGAAIDWHELEFPVLQYRRKLELPTYPFHGKRFWFDGS